MVCSIMTAALACTTLAPGSEEQRSRGRSELFLRGLKSKLRRNRAHLRSQVPRCGADHGARTVFFGSSGQSGRFPNQTPYIGNNQYLNESHIDQYQ